MKLWVQSMFVPKRVFNGGANMVIALIYIYIDWYDQREVKVEFWAKKVEWLDLYILWRWSLLSPNLNLDFFKMVSGSISFYYCICCFTCDKSLYESFLWRKSSWYDLIVLSTWSINNVAALKQLSWGWKIHLSLIVNVEITNGLSLDNRN